MLPAAGLQAHKIPKNCRRAAVGEGVPHGFVAGCVMDNAKGRASSIRAALETVQDCFLDGSMFGPTSAGGATGFGEVFKLSPDNQHRE